MIDKNNIPSRRKFLLFGSLASASLLVFSFFKIRFQKPKGNTVKMLSQDGKLVEVDLSKMNQSGKKISDKELQQWVKR